MKYNSDKFKAILIPIELKDELTEIMYDLIYIKIKNKEKKIEVSYGEVIKVLLEMYKEETEINKG
jgi:hypothetical protein